MNVLKLKKLLVSLLIIILISVNASALNIEDHSLEFNASEEYTLLTADNLKKNKDFIKSLGHSVASMQTFFKDNSVLIFAANSDNSKQIKLTHNKTDFSTQIGSLRTLSDEKLDDISEQVLGQDAKGQLYITNNMKMYCVASKSSDSGGNYCTIQFFTIINGNIYNLSYSESSADVYAVYDNAQDIVANLKITDKALSVTAEDVDNDVIMALVAILVLAALAVAVYVIVTFVKDIKNKQSSEEDDSVIRRRRF